MEAKNAKPKPSAEQTQPQTPKEENQHEVIEEAYFSILYNYLKKANF